MRLASLIGSELTGVILVLDEPTMGLHAQDTQKLAEKLIRLKECGNTVVVVEHDREVIKLADYVLDIGCGWGPMLKSTNDHDGDSIGLSLSPKQVKACRQNGLNVILRDWKELQPGELGKFEVVISIGSFEHFCSVEEYFEGKRDKIYDRFFRTCHDLLVDDGRLYLQTMTWGKNLP